MGRVANPALAAAVAEAGGLGMLALSRHSPEAASRDIADVQSRTAHPVGVTLLVEFLEEPLLRAVAERVRVVELFWGWPDPALVPTDNIVGWQVGSADEAKAAVDAGCRFVVAQGVEAGGHVRGTTPLAELVPLVRAAVDVPIVAAGGIGTRADVEHALALGADAVRVGTRFVAANESAAHPEYVDLLSAATGADTQLTETFGAGWPDAPHRVLSSSVEAALDGTADPVATMQSADGTTIPFVRFGTAPPTADMTGDIRAMALYAGTGVDAVHGRVAAADIVAELAEGLEQRVTERVVITGANRGLGLELARQHSERGDEVWAGCRRPDDAAELRDLTAHVKPVDMASEESIERFADSLGPGPIDVLYNNAGIDARSLGVDDGARDVLRLSGEHFLEEMRINAVGPMLLARALLDRLAASSNPRIVNVTSQVGSMEVAHTIGRDIGYVSSKAALNMISVRQSVHLRDAGIVVIALHPGHLKTDMGGERANLTTAEGATGILALVDGLTMADSGTFRRWDGTVHPW